MTDWEIVKQPQKESDWELVSDSPSDMPEANKDRGVNTSPLHSEPFLKRLARDIVTGGLNASRSAFNKPFEIHEALKDIGAGINKNSSFMQPPNNIQLPHIDPNINFAKELLGQPDQGTILDNLIQSGLGMIPDLYLGGKGASSVLKNIPAWRGMSASKLKEAERLIGETKTPISKELIEQARKHFPTMAESDELLAKAMEGKYKEAFKTQSHVGKRARSLEKSSVPDDRDLRAPAAHSLKKALVNDMAKALRKEGKEEEAKLLIEGIDDVRQYHKVRNILLKSAGIMGGTGLSWKLLKLMIFPGGSKND